MGNLLGMQPIDCRIYKDPKDKDSDYYAFPIVTITDTVLDLKTGEKLSDTLLDIKTKLTFISQEPAVLSASFLGISFLE